jgi:hypothetical protein
MSLQTQNFNDAGFSISSRKLVAWAVLSKKWRLTLRRKLFMLL